VELTYRLEIRGPLPRIAQDELRDRFGDVRVQSDGEQTVVSGRSADQAALRAALSLLWDVGVEVRLVEATPPGWKGGRVMTDTREAPAATAASPEEPQVQHGPRSWWVGAVALAALVFVAIVSTLSMAPTAPLAADAPAEVFSAARAMVHIETIAQNPRPVGSAEHAEARAYLLKQLASLGWRTEVQESVGMFDFGGDGTQSIAAVANVIATKPGSAASGTVLLTAHYDTVAGSPGAADDGIGVGVLLETARALSTLGPARNDIVILLTDAEEIGLHGAEAFVRERAEALGPTVVLNHEARGASGAPITFRMSSPNGELLDVLSQASGAAADSSAEAIFETLPNNTDFTPFLQAGLHGYDTAIAAGGGYYHSPLDDPAHLSTASLQQMGDTTFELTRELAGTDLAAIAEGDEEIVTTMPWGLLRYPQALEMPLAVGTLILTAVLVWLLRRRGALTLPRVALSALASVVCLVAASAAGYAVWRVALLVAPGQASAENGEPYESLLYRLAMLLAGLGVVLGLYAILRRWLRAAELATGMLIVLGLVGVVFAFTLPGVSGSLVQPSLVVAGGATLAALLLERHTVAAGIAYLIALAVAAMMLGPAVWTGFDIGLGTGGPASAAQLAVFVLLALPLIEVVWPNRPGLSQRRLRAATVPAVVLFLAVVFTAGGLVANQEGATDPRQEVLRYSVDADTGGAYWASSRAPVSDWATMLLTESPAPLDDAFPWSDRRALWHGPALAADLPAPKVTVVRDHIENGQRKLTLRLRSQRDAPSLGLWIEGDSATVRSAVVAGHAVPTDRPLGKWSFGFRFFGAPADGVVVQLELDQHTDDVVLRIADSTDDVRAVPGFSPPPNGRVLVEPEVVVTRQLAL
jgi:Peptidase family M28